MLKNHHRTHSYATARARAPPPAAAAAVQPDTAAAVVAAAAAAASAAAAVAHPAAAAPAAVAPTSLRSGSRPRSSDESSSSCRRHASARPGPAESHCGPRFPGTPSHAARPPDLLERTCFATSWHVPLGSSSLRGERLRARVMSGQSSPRSTWPPPDDRLTDCFYQGRSKARSMI